MLTRVHATGNHTRRPQSFFFALISRGSPTFSMAVLLVQIADRFETSQTTSGMSYSTSESAFYAIVWL